MATEIMKMLIPIFLGLIVFEAVYSKWTGKGLYRFKDTLSNLKCGMVQNVAEVLIRVGFFVLYKGIYDNARIFTLPDHGVSWLLAIVVVDLATYLAHRASHRVNLFWAAHLVHHQSETFNFSTALRLSAFQRLLNFPFFFAPLALLGMSTDAFVFANVVVGANGFWNHTQIIGRLRWLEWLLVTPSHHRVHHASNSRYIDKNYSNVFTVWDHLFGSYQEETEKPVFGITHPMKALTPIEANLGFFKILKANAQKETTLLGKFSVYFGKPENLDYSMIEPFQDPELTQRQKWGALAFLSTAFVALGVFLKMNRGIGESEFTLPSLTLALAVVLPSLRKEAV